MQTVGLIRTIDGLGRIVIPMELRKNFRLGEGDPLEIFISDDSIILKRVNKPDVKDELQRILEDCNGEMSPMVIGLIQAAIKLS